MKNNSRESIDEGPVIPDAPQDCQSDEVLHPLILDDNLVGTNHDESSERPRLSQVKSRRVSTARSTVKKDPSAEGSSDADGRPAAVNVITAYFPPKLRGDCLRPFFKRLVCYSMGLNVSTEKLFLTKGMEGALAVLRPGFSFDELKPALLAELRDEIRVDASHSIDMELSGAASSGQCISIFFDTSADTHQAISQGSTCENQFGSDVAKRTVRVGASYMTPQKPEYLPLRIVTLSPSPITSEEEDVAEAVIEECRRLHSCYAIEISSVMTSSSGCNLKARDRIVASLLDEGLSKNCIAVSAIDVEINHMIRSLFFEDECQFEDIRRILSRLAALSAREQAFTEAGSFAVPTAECPVELIPTLRQMTEQWKTLQQAAAMLLC
ncbi:hypothetical protein FOZ63_032477 [Perkinsus olseni]|uniref:Uncharacterized protein n=1 Tax=Perkinsus olseni TaxID=32597 RepID=A0A7J6SYU5_PEROL|nr:hypothetical protein FOZ63_032477 [Perkinsus olseni]KAF4755105.1 hypothetical protein FOZ62_001103 [Perkinsus olseni]